MRSAGHGRTLFRSRRPFALLTLFAVLAVAACGTDEPGTTPTEPEGTETAGTEPDGSETDGTEPSADGRPTPILDLMEEIKGMTLEERREYLLPIAEEEERLTAYITINIDDATALINGFEDFYEGPRAHVYRSQASVALQRIIQEEDAGFTTGMDFGFIAEPEIDRLAERGYFAPIESPAAENIPEGMHQGSWIGCEANAALPGWNTDRVTNPPTTWQEVLQFDGVMALEPTNWDKFGTIVNYLVEEAGMSEEEAIDLWRDAADNSSAVQGQTNVALQVATGELDMAPILFINAIRDLVEENAPIAYTPPVQPIMVDLSGCAINVHTDQPAATLLMLDFMLTKGQEILAEVGRGPVSTVVEGALLEPGWEALRIDQARMEDEQDKWERLWEEILRGIG